MSLWLSTYVKWPLYIIMPSNQNIVYASSPNIIRMTKSRKMRWAGHVARMGEMRNEYRILIGKPEDHSEDLGEHRSIILKWISGKHDWIHLAQDRDRWRTLVNTVRNLRVHKKRGISWSAQRTISISKRTRLHGVLFVFITRLYEATYTLVSFLAALSGFPYTWLPVFQQQDGGGGGLSRVLLTVFQFTSQCFPMEHP
jgi:hypothetical protein